MSELMENHFIPSVDVCGFCSDCYCDGIACIASLNPDNPDDYDAIEELQDLLRFGRAWRASDALLTHAGYKRMFRVPAVGGSAA